MDELPFSPGAVAAYLGRVHRAGVTSVRLAAMGEGARGDKQYGYGIPLRVDYELGGQRRSAVLESMRPGPFGHEHMADRAQALLWAHRAFGRLPGHVASLDVGAVRAGGELVPLGDAEEFFMLAEFAEGREYAEDLLRIRSSGELHERDARRADALCAYLARIHAVRGTDPGLYARRIRELLGHGECIFGITDSYPAQGAVAPRLLEDIERRCLAWRWKLKGRAGRLRQVHGDFHPWNLLFRGDAEFTALDRSRGEWGEPADDVACLTMNYLFFSLQRSGRLEGAFERLFRDFWERYLDRTGDLEILEAVAPFFAFRGLVMASPVWYPDLAGGLRERILHFCLAVLDDERFEPARANLYCGI